MLTIPNPSSLIGAVMGKLTPILLSMLLAALALAGVQTVRLARSETAFANHRASVAAIRATMEEQHAIDMEAARTVETRLAAEADTTRKEKYEAVTTLDRRVAALLERLRLERTPRPAAPEGAGLTVASTGPSGTGAGLHIEDGEFLVGEAAAAARIGFERDACIRLYNAARDAAAGDH